MGSSLEPNNASDLVSETENASARSGPRILFIRYIAGLLGLSLLALSLAVDFLGIGDPGELGSGQIILGLFGLGFLVTGVLGRRAKSLYIALSILTLNTLVILAGLELLAVALVRSGIVHSPQQNIVSNYKDLPYYQNQAWTEQLWIETNQAESYAYEPYVIWRHREFSGELVNVDARGRRVTPGADCGAASFTVFTFGGSTMWGWGAPDWGTIPAYLQSLLERTRDGRVCVVNLAEDGFVSTQSLAQLMLELRSGNVPDVVVFYSGVNDTYSAFVTREAGAPYTLTDLQAKFEDHPLSLWFRGSRIFALISRQFGVKVDRESTISLLSQGQNQEALPILSEEVSAGYLQTYRMVLGLSQAFEFDFYFVWQPHIVVSSKRLTEEEAGMRSQIDPGLAELTQLAYGQIEEAAQLRDSLWYFGEVLDRETGQVWIDSGSHVTPEGNQIIAESLLRIMSGDSGDG